MCDLWDIHKQSIEKIPNLNNILGIMIDIFTFILYLFEFWSLLFRLKYQSSFLHIIWLSVGLYFIICLCPYGGGLYKFSLPFVKSSVHSIRIASYGWGWCWWLSNKPTNENETKTKIERHMGSNGTERKGYYGVAIDIELDCDQGRN